MRKKLDGIQISLLNDFFPVISETSGVCVKILIFPRTRTKRAYQSSRRIESLEKGAENGMKNVNKFNFSFGSVSTREDFSSWSRDGSLDAWESRHVSEINDNNFTLNLKKILKVENFTSHTHLISTNSNTLSS